MAYVSDTRVEATLQLRRVTIVRDFPDFFPEELSVVPPERQVDFQIDLMPSLDPITKASYRLAPPKMQELSM